MLRQQWIFLPVLAQVFLTLLLYIQLSMRKKRAARAGAVNEARRALHADAWPDSVQQVNNCIRNQFEVPVLFYVLSLVLFATQAVDGIALGIASLFVFSRYAHAYVHTGINIVPIRRKLFTLGCVLVLILLVLVVKGVV